MFKRFGNAIWIWISAAAAFAFVAMLRISSCWTTENSIDGLYHMRLAREGWDVFSAKTFPTLTLSLWTDTFADKELLYHMMLSWLDDLRRVLGIADFPFNFQSLFFLALLVAAFAWCGRTLKIRNTWFLLLLLFGLCSEFTFRMLMLRPHVLAVALMTAFTAVCAIDLKRWNFAAALAGGFIFAWSYSNPHFIYLAAGSFAFGFWLNGERRRSVMLLLGVTAGLFAGYVIHPQSPNTFVNWVVQCVVVPQIMMQKETLVELGTEVRVSGLFHWWKMPFLLALVAFNCAATLYCLFRKRGIFRRPEVTALCVMALATGIGTLNALRVVEYSPVFNLLYAALILESFEFKFAASRTVFLRTLKLAVALAMLTFTFTRLYPSPVRHLPKYVVAEYIRSHFRPGTVIGNLDWSEFPQLYYLLPDYRFICALDPTFGLAADAERYAKIEAQRRQVVDPPFAPEELADLLGTQVMYIGYPKLAFFLYERGYRRVLFQGEGGYLFLLRR